MASSFSTSLKLEKMTTGEKAGLWGTVTNTNLDLVEQAVGGFVALSLASGNQTVAISNGAASDGRNKVIKLTGSLTANRSLIFPDSTEKTYIVIDATTRTSNHYTITIKTASGSGLTMPVGANMFVIVDGTNVVNGFVEKGYQTTTTAYTAVNGDQIFVDTASTAETITLPASPAILPKLLLTLAELPLIFFNWAFVFPKAADALLFAIISISYLLLPLILCFPF